MKSLSINNYPYNKYLHTLLKTIASPQIGILRSIILSQFDKYMPRIFSYGGDMSAIQRMIGIEQDFQYHVGGYGIYYEEALIRILSESLERYCLMIFPHFVKKQVIYASYNELLKKGEDLPPFEFYKLFNDNEYAKDGFPFNKPSAEQTIGWIKCMSIFCPDKELLTPIQMLFPGYIINESVGETRWAPGFSTGSASNTSYDSALLSALSEIIEIDAFQINWFTERPSPRISFEGTILDDIVKKTLDTNVIEPIFLYHTLPDLNIHTITTFLVNKKQMIPAVTCGSHADLDPINCAYRSMTESSATGSLGMFGMIYQSGSSFYKKDYKTIQDLDSNVSFYSDLKNYDLSTDLIKKMTSETTIHIDDLPNLVRTNKQESLAYTINELRKVSNYGVVIDITTPDVASLGFRVVKAFIPELTQMSLPSYPYSCHPRVKKYGGVKNEYPHPLP